MGIQKKLSITYGAVLVGVVAVAILSVMLKLAADHHNVTEERRYLSCLLEDELRQSSDDLTRFARTYVMTGDPRYEKMYWEVLDIRNGKKPRPDHYERIYWDLVLDDSHRPRPATEAMPLRELQKKAGFTDAEFAKLAEAQSNSDALVKTEEIAMNMVKGLYDDGSGNFTRKGKPDLQTARKLMYDETYHRVKASIMKPIEEFQEMLDLRTRLEAIQSFNHTRNLFWLLQSILVGLAFFIALLFALKKRQQDLEAMVARHSVELAASRALAEQEMRNAAQAEKHARELEAANAAIVLARDAAEAATRAKSVFLANMSHEIRTPLNAVIGMTELVLRSQLSVQQREFLHTVRDSGEALLSVINDILDFSKIEAGKLTLDSSTFDLRESLGDTMKTFAIRAHQQGLELACFIHPEIPRLVVGDYHRLRQIVVNLVGNAIKFTEAGEVSLEVTRESHSEKDVVLHFLVADTGSGISPEKHSTIFEIFVQGDASTTRRHGGTGLGLAIASRLVALMDGRIWVESEVGRGSRFHFTVRLDLTDREPAEPLPLEPACLHGMRVLVVDDNATNRRILDEVLRSWQVLPTTAPSAAEAIRLLLEAQQKGEPYRLVLTDAHMPRMDGFMLAEQIKQNSTMASTVVMMLTSGDHPDDMQRCEALGISAYLLKPIKQSELLEAIELALGITTAKTGLLAPAGPPRRVESLRILLAEDSLVNQTLAVALLEEQGHKVHVVNNGREAIAAWQAKEFDLVLMDVQMPEMDGLEATEKIRGREQHTGAHIPIVAMTAHALKGDRERCLAAGMDGYIAKPIHSTELFNVIGGLFAAPAELVEPPVLEMTEGGIVDWQAALQAVGRNHQLLRTIVEAALEEIPRLMAAICRAIASSDATALRLAAHTLKGSLRYFGKTTACEKVFRLEMLGQARNLTEANALLSALEPEIVRIKQALQAYLQRNPMSNDSYETNESR